MLRDFAEHLSAERVSLEDIIAALGDRGLGVLIAIFAVPNIFPSTVPFGNVVTGIPVIFLAVHLMLGWPRLVLPRFSPGAASGRRPSKPHARSWRRAGPHRAAAEAAPARVSSPPPSASSACSA